MEKCIPVTGFEPAAYRLKAGRSANWATQVEIQWINKPQPGFEPGTYALEVRRSSELSYNGKALTRIELVFPDSKSEVITIIL